MVTFIPVVTKDNVLGSEANNGCLEVKNKVFIIEGNPCFVKKIVVNNTNVPVGVATALRQKHGEDSS